MPVNRNLLRLELARQSDTIYRLVKPKIEKAFNERKQEMIQEFESHPVTKELSEGPQASSSYIKTAKGGNLYSLIGFNAGENPTEAIREILEKDVRLNLSQVTREVKTNSIVFKTPVRSPSLGEFNNKIAGAVPLEWTSRSFTDLIEKGITGFGSYLFDNLRRFKTSRSGPAIQIDSQMRSGSAPRIRYISEILANFRRSITGK